MRKESRPVSELEQEVWGFIENIYPVGKKELQKSLKELRSAKKAMDKAFDNEENKLTSEGALISAFFISASSVAYQKGLHSKSIGISKSDVPTALKALKVFAKENGTEPVGIADYVKILLIGELTEARKNPKRSNANIDRAKFLSGYYKELQ